MKRVLISLFAATILFGAAGFTVVNRVADTPQCCQNKESCCPGSSCCSGGNNAQCAMTHAHHTV
jgi:hypothetical protein